MAGARVRCTLATKLVNELVEARGERHGPVQGHRRYGRVDLLCIGLCRPRDYRGGRLILGTRSRDGGLLRCSRCGCLGIVAS
jgi:hypothetical protein